MPDLRDYLAEARHLERQGEFVEALCCYEAMLRDPLIDQDQPLLEATGIGMAHLLIAQSAQQGQSDRQARLIDRAIAVLSRSVGAPPHNRPSALLLAEAYGLRFALFGQRRDLLAANLQIDLVAQDGRNVLPETLEKATTLRAQLAAIEPPRA